MLKNLACVFWTFICRFWYPWFFFSWEQNLCRYRSPTYVGELTCFLWTTIVTIVLILGIDWGWEDFFPVGLEMESLADPSAGFPVCSKSFKKSWPTPGFHNQEVGCCHLQKNVFNPGQKGSAGVPNPTWILVSPSLCPEANLSCHFHSPTPHPRQAESFGTTDLCTWSCFSL